MTDRSIEALGYTDVPALQPLTYPGRVIDEPVLLSGKELLALGVQPRRLGAWTVRSGVASGEETLDAALERLGQASVGGRYPVVSVGSNAAPGQVSHKFDRIGVPDEMPMIPVRVRGIKVGLSAHISPAGYVAAAPYMDPAAETSLVVTWLDAAQLKVVDDTEFPGYRRALLPGDVFPMTMPSGERLGAAYIYFSAYGVLAGPNGSPAPAAGTRPPCSGNCSPTPPRCANCSARTPRPGSAGRAPTRRRGTGALVSSERRAGSPSSRSSCPTSPTTRN